MLKITEISNYICKVYAISPDKYVTPSEKLLNQILFFF